MSAGETPAPGRESELAEALASTRARIAAAVTDAGRDPAGVRLVVVTKNFPRSDLDALVRLGVRDVGENKEQELTAKMGEAPLPEDVRVHFIGQLQSRKSGAVARVADVVHSVDRVKLVGALARGAEAAGRHLTVLLQVSLDGDPQRGGALPADVPALADAVASAGLTLGGVMAVAPLGEEPRAAFARLREVSERLRVDHPGAVEISAGMSGDLEAAIHEGATLLRVGTAILGSRPSHR